MKTIPVFWHGQKDGRGFYNCTTFINHIFDRAGLSVHEPAWDGITEGTDGGIVVVHGGREPDRFQKLCDDINELDWVFLIFLGDEEGSFPAEFVTHPRMVRWIQEPILGRHDTFDGFLIDGYTPKINKMDGLLGYPPDRLPRDLDWMFAGQVTHQRRIECVNALMGIPEGGVIVQSKGYCQGVSIIEYNRLMHRAKIVPCPSGPHSQDSARPWEALECGAIPILDNFSPQRSRPGFWNLVLGTHPLPTINEWDNVERYIELLTDNWEEQQQEVQRWWRDYKMGISAKFVNQLHRLRDGK